MKKQTEIITYRETEIYCPVINGVPYVAIKPVCEALGIDRKSQQKKISDHPILKKVAETLPATGRDEKERMMFCIPYRYVFGWLFNIDVNSVREEIRPRVLLYQEECYEILFEHFVGRSERYKQRDNRIQALQKEIDDLEKSIADKKKQVKEKMKEQEHLILTPIDQLDMFEAYPDSL